MKKLTFLLLFLIITTAGVNAQDDMSSMMVPPPPVENAVLDAMVGTWTGTSNMMGMTMNETVTCHWDLNHQFLIMKLESVSEYKSQKYTGMGIYGVDANGNLKSWWFDDWGANGTMVGTGTFDGMTLHMTGENEMYADDRHFKFTDDGQMIMTWKGTMQLPTGDLTMNGETVYTKK